VRTHLKIILLQNSALGITSRAKGKLQPEHAGTHTHTALQTREERLSQRSSAREKVRVRESKSKKKKITKEQREAGLKM